MYTIKSTSNDGIWYLINGWWRHKAYWQQYDNCSPDTTFKRISDAKRGLTNLLKYMMAEYDNDDFTLVEFTWNDKAYCYEEREIEKIII